MDSVAGGKIKLLTVRGQGQQKKRIQSTAAGYDVTREISKRKVKRDNCRKSRGKTYRDK